MLRGRRRALLRIVWLLGWLLGVVILLWPTTRWTIPLLVSRTRPADILLLQPAVRAHILPGILVPVAADAPGCSLKLVGCTAVAVHVAEVDGVVAARMVAEQEVDSRLLDSAHEAPDSCYAARHGHTHSWHMDLDHGRSAERVEAVEVASCFPQRCIRHLHPSLGTGTSSEMDTTRSDPRRNLLDSMLPMLPRELADLELGRKTAVGEVDQRVVAVQALVPAFLGHMAWSVAPSRATPPSRRVLSAEC